MPMVDAFLTNMYRARADFVYTVTRDFVRGCQTPILVLPDDVPAHPYAVAMETVHLAPSAHHTDRPLGLLRSNTAGEDERFRDGDVATVEAATAAPRMAGRDKGCV